MVKETSSWKCLSRITAMLVMAIAIAGCAAGVVKHALSFDARDEPGVEIIDYRHGDSRQPGARANPHDVARGERIAQYFDINGEIKRPNSLLEYRYRKVILLAADSGNQVAEKRGTL